MKSVEYKRQIPDANVLLDLLHQQDNAVVQVKLKQCKVANIFAGQAGTGPKYDIYRCDVEVESYDAELNQYFTKNRQVDLSLDDSETGWSLFTDS
ncbi:hypothetical protein CAP51_02690 [Acinetobacter populi]|uniref:Uncharacterized protein n=2 Tax=Acinetobacter populi TaxID=1582270 RepID=A0A1Z9Z431_9GAMM|nr:hypothetical protein CAP51_02690 [Acinetobacter populi]